MKSIVTVFVFFLALSFSFGQELATVKSKSELTAIKRTGEGSIILPANLTNDLVQSKAKYYAHYFSIDFNEKSKEAKFTMVENTEKSRAVIVRFLAACDVTEIDVEGTIVKRDDLFVNYLK
mgnify:CR=1 FL=1